MAALLFSVRPSERAEGICYFLPTYPHYMIYLNEFHVHRKHLCFQPRNQKTKNGKRLWAHIDSDVWVKCSVCQMNSDSMFITPLHTALHTHAVFRINKQPSCNLPLSWTKIDLALQIHWLLARNHTSSQSSLVGIITHIIQYHRILQEKKKLTTRFTGMKLASMEAIRNWTLKNERKHGIG